MSFIQPICIGQGYQLLFVDLTASDADLLAAASIARAKVIRYDPEKELATYEASSPVGSSVPAASKDPVLYTDTRADVLGEPYPATIFRFGHTFDEKGKYLIGISLEDADGNETWSVTPIVVAVTNGLPEGY
jgi:hypothetical protein